MKFFPALALVLAASPALAHPSHVAESAGHSHYLALGAIGAAVVVASLAVLRAVTRRRSAARE